MNARLIIFTAVVTLSFSGISAQAGHINVDLNLELGGVFRPVIVREVDYRSLPVPYYSAPVFSGGGDDLRFIPFAESGLFVAIGVPYDLCYLDRNYYLFNSGRWFRSTAAHGPWMALGDRDLPIVLRQRWSERMRDERQYGRGHRPEGRQPFQRPSCDSFSRARRAW